uniref:Endonuclease/exonuclease/phosphatase domain-containing protein n=1 Tax=Odontella aurita TaxID=265563 RepID=A0A7S4IG57_9STRA|mmetsp:Transcript_24724/g.72373  ORF Transcript_24724/g.72373 Transcript_24724/m.72373 type:complete len:472 (+) Transcript_24724:112-1527(+)
MITSSKNQVLGAVLVCAASYQILCLGFGWRAVAVSSFFPSDAASARCRTEDDAPPSKHSDDDDESSASLRGLIAEVGRSPPPPPVSEGARSDGFFRVATWNLRVPFPPDEAGGNSWLARRPYVAQAIRSAGPDILGLQEDCYFMNEDLLLDYSLSEEYDRYGLFNRNGEDGAGRPREGRGRKGRPENVFTKDGLRDGEHNSVWWRRDVFELVRNDTFWLSRQPHIPGTSFNESTGRVVNCVLLRDKRGDQEGGFARSKNDGRIVNDGGLVRLCSAHFPSDESLALRSAPVALEQIRLLEQTGLSVLGRQRSNVDPAPVTFLVGDFNSAPSSKTYNALSQPEWFTESTSMCTKPPSIAATAISAETIPANISTTTWYQNDEMLIDYIWLSCGDEGPSVECPIVIDSVTHFPVLTSIPAPVRRASRLDSSNVLKGLDWHNIAARNLPCRFASDHMMIVAYIHWKDKMSDSGKR